MCHIIVEVYKVPSFILVEHLVAYFMQYEKIIGISSDHMYGNEAWHYVGSGIFCHYSQSFGSVKDRNILSL